MENKALTTSSAPLGAAIEQVLIGGDLSRLTSEQRVSYYNKTCESLGLNSLTQPFAYINLNGKLTLYARKDCTEQLRGIRNISIGIASREVVEGVYVVTARATNPAGRMDESIGAVPIDKLTGEARANAMMKAETKAKRRVTLSFCGLGILDETEIESIPGARVETPSHRPTASAPPVIDAEVVPSPAPPVDENRAKALRGMFAAIKEAGITEVERKHWMGMQLGHTVETSKSLTDAEIATVTKLAREMAHPTPTDDEQEAGTRG
ncbi:MAG TPA: hypothetical protein VJ801_11725 [Polyangia bacterium]|jgi:hypothetical protein|nr:hypothetical protein [Polyangia bacterium]